jgi:drug/metabolite transporter (DMT)-like permease
MLSPFSDCQAKITVSDILLFSSHVLLWTIWTILIRISRQGDDYAYEIVGVVLLTELTKFVLSLINYLFITGHEYPTHYEAVSQALARWSMGIYFAVPAFIYTVYNSLFFLNLVFFDPVSYRVLINMRILWSGILFQIFFSKKLGFKKWVALVLLMLGCVVNQLGSSWGIEAKFIHILAICFQAFTSSFGGVYSEWLVKKNLDVSLNVKNMYLYFFSIMFNLLFIIIFKPQMIFEGTYFVGYTNLVVFVIFFGAFCGFSTSLFLRYLNILLKEYAHSAEMLLTAVIGVYLWGTVLDAKLLMSIGLVSASIVLYNQN